MSAPRPTRASAAVVLLLTPALVLTALPAAAQEAESSAAEASGVQALRVFLDCDRCDFDFLRREVVHVNYVRDRRDAQVHVLVTTDRAGAGRQFTLNFIGLGAFEGVEQKLVYTSSNTDTDDERRRGFARIFQLGLVRYVLDTPMADGLRISYDPPEELPSQAARPEDDRWDFWVYRVGANTNLREEQRQDSQSLSGRLNASRVTEAWKMNFGANGNYSSANFELEDGEILESVTRDFRLGGQIIKSLGPHWGAGVGASGRQSTFLNLDRAYRVAAAVEYNLYPYSLSSERELTFSYFVGVSRLHYEEVTLFDKLEETRPNHGLIVSYDVERPWGEADVTLDFSQFVDDSSKYDAEIFGRVNYRIFRGLSLSVFASASVVRNQIYLPRRGATDEEVLLRLRALETDSRFGFGLGLNYTFGSIYNNIVNSRLSRGSRGFTRIF